MLLASVGATVLSIRTGDVTEAEVRALEVGDGGRRWRFVKVERREDDEFGGRVVGHEGYVAEIGLQELGDVLSRRRR